MTGNLAAAAVVVGGGNAAMCAALAGRARDAAQRVTGLPARVSGGRLELQFGDETRLEELVELLEERQTTWAAELDAAAGRQVSTLAGAGAAGGIGAALLALGARRESGAAVIAEHTRLAADIAAAELIITGEGRFDDQSLHGKVVSALAAGAVPRGVPVLVLAGQVTLGPAALRRAGIVAAYAVADYAGSVRLAIDDAANQLAGLARRTAAGLTGVKPG